MADSEFESREPFGDEIVYAPLLETETLRRPLMVLARQTSSDNQPPVGRDARPTR